MVRGLLDINKNYEELIAKHNLIEADRNHPQLFKFYIDCISKALNDLKFLNAGMKKKKQ